MIRSTIRDDSERAREAAQLRSEGTPQLPPDEPQREFRSWLLWIAHRSFGLVALTVVAAGQFVILLAYLFSPDKPVYERPLEPHWTDDIASVWLGCSALAVVLALVGLVVDRRKEMAAIALGAAFIGFIWPWGA